jgi:glycosyltransferase involved in cell wall biosynthesis
MARGKYIITMTKKILIITDNLPEQINGVVTTYKNIELPAARDGYTVDYIHPGQFRYVDCPGYNEVKLAYPKGLGRAIEEIQPDYIHIATEGFLGLFARRYLTKHRIKYNTAYHTKFPEAIRKLFGVPEIFTWPLIRWFHSNSNAVLTTTPSMVEELKSHGFGNNVIPWTRGVDRETFWPSKHRFTSDKVILLNVGRVSKEKNLEAFYEMDFPNCQKIQVGDGPMLKKYIKRYPDVHFVGAKRGRELADFYRNADVFVFPSSWDTFGLVMIEAMACGTPVAAYPVQGPLDVIDVDTGVMDEDLATAVRRALDLNRVAVENASHRWNWERAWEIFKETWSR